MLFPKPVVPIGHRELTLFPEINLGTLISGGTLHLQNKGYFFLGSIISLLQ